jgi:tetratricopeptide (TPR) repeat protein
VAPEAITVPAEHLWWLAASQDTVLLSDRRIHHYTEIANVDREQERISFSDPWPDDFFLLRGRNALGIAARRDPGLSISKAEFLRVVTGLVTWDTQRLVQHYFAAFPDRRADRDTLVRFGFALLDAEADELAPMAADLFAEAALLAAAVGSNEDAKRAAQQAYLAASCGACRAATGGNRAALAAMQAVLRLVTAAYGRPALEAGLLTRELARLGNAAGYARDFKQARAVLDLAIGKDAAFEDGHWLRASVALQDGEPAAAAADAERALELNDAQLAKLAAERAAIDPRGRWELEWKDSQIGGCRARRASELAVMVNAQIGLGDLARARAAAAALIELQPRKPLRHLKLALVARAAGTCGRHRGGKRGNRA